jgi:alpha-tubulin suppressor-like RCC1 family protein
VSGSGVQPLPIRVDTPVRFVSVTVGGVHSCARTRSGQAWCWGRNVYGQLGDGTNVNREVPTRVVGPASFVALNATGAHTCGTANDGETWCWGFNVEGQLGDGTRNHSARPTRVTLAGR